MPNHERQAATAINQSWPVLERYFDSPAWRQTRTTDPAAILRDMPWAQWTQEVGRVVDPLERATREAFEGEVGNIKGTLKFDVIDDVTVRYAAQQGSKLIRSITESQRETVRQMVASAVQGNMTVDQLGRRLRQTVGLHPAWAQAVVRFEERQYNQLIKEGKTPEVAEATAARRAEAKRKSLLKRRGENIARTEIQTASNLGKYASWDAAIAQGFASKQSRKEFSPGPGACDICAPISGEVVGWDEPFSNGKTMPPFHPSCRCTANLLPPDYNDAELDPDAFDWLDDSDVMDRPEFQPTLAGRIGNLTNRPEPFVAPPKPPPVQPEDDVATPEEMAAHIEEHAVDGTEAEQRAANLYRGGARYNGALRAGSVNEHLQEQVDDLTRFIEKQPEFGRPVTLYRGMSKNFLPDAESLVGKTITEPAFMSTGLSRRSAELFAGEDDILFEIRAGARHKGLSINVATMPDQSRIPLEYREPRNVLARESEILLPPGTDLLITKVGWKTAPDGRRHKVVEAEIVDRPLAPPPPKTVADSLTLQSTADLTDDELNDLIVKYADSDPEAMDKVLDIIDERDAIRARNAAFDAAEEAREAAAREAANDWGTIPEEFVTTPAISPSRSAARNLTPDERVAEDFFAYVQVQYSKALNDLNGVFLNDLGKAQGINSESLFTGSATRARKYASEELIAWWEDNGRHNKGSFRYGALKRPRDRHYLDTLRAEGFEGRLGVSRDRSAF